MEKPTITINGKEIEMVDVKVRLWLEAVELSTQTENVLSTESVKKYCQLIAKAFGVTAEEVFDNVSANEIVPKFFEVVRWILSMLTEKVGKKNAEVAEEI